MFRLTNYETAMLAYKRWHYLSDTSFLSRVNFGAYFNGLLQGAISYGSPNATDLAGYFDRTTQDGWWEIKRLAMSEVCPRNSESRFIGRTIRMLRERCRVKGIITYADTAQNHKGTIYKASGFRYLGLTFQKNDYWIDDVIQQRGRTNGVNGEWKPRSQKHLFVKAF
jgi:hypothetical protein